ncbi:MAG: RNA polymerase sigma factor [Acidobacteria bacterium]|nr:RNA polymerase sigma factor [Acidobacteriota bacterium]
MNEEDTTQLVKSLFDSWYSSLVRFAFRQTGDMALAEDLVQDSFMELHLALRRGETIRSPKGWTLCVLRRGIIDHGSRKMPHDPLDDFLDCLPAGAASLPDHAYEMDELLRHFSVLSSREEEVLLLRMEALKYREIADQLGISTNSVTTLLARALRKLQRVMGIKKNSVDDERFLQTKTDVPKTLQ